MAKPAILLVDDEEQFRESLSAALEEEFHVLAASNVRDGLALINNTCFSLILLDLQMPAITGFDMLGILRRNNNTPVFILTGHSCQEWAEKSADLNVQCILKSLLIFKVLSAG